MKISKILKKIGNALNPVKLVQEAIKKRLKRSNKEQFAALEQQRGAFS